MKEKEFTRVSEPGTSSIGRARTMRALFIGALLCDLLCLFRLPTGGQCHPELSA